MKPAAGISQGEIKQAYGKEKGGRVKQRLLIILKALRLNANISSNL
ncbi:hypothetical protein KY347_04405 [Candidatus Woesearchaeota archaeon]|nr:hypothetical protein [Candidatus Woesearchaeota archaeon]